MANNKLAAHLLERTVIYEHNKIHSWNGCGTLVTDGKVLIASWYTGGPKEPHPNNHVVVSRSFDGGRTWTKPDVIDDPPGNLRAGDPILWRDQDRVIHLTYANHDPSKTTGDWSYYHQTCLEPSADTMSWSPRTAMDPEFDDFMFNNKPIQLRTGEWFGPVAIRTGPRQGNPYHEGFYSAGSLVSLDNGSNWKVVSRTPELAASGYGWPDTRVWEPTAFQKDDGTIAMYVRNSWGIIHVTFSNDSGHSWSEFEPTVMVNPCSRFHIRKLPSELGGAVICLDNPVADQGKGAQNRTPLGMYISYDDGDTFTRLVILDPHGL